MIPFICHCDRITGIFFTLVRVKSQFCDRISGLTAIRKRIVFNKSASLLRYDPILTNEQRPLVNFIPDVKAWLMNVKTSPLIIHFLAADPKRDPCINILVPTVIKLLAVKSDLMRRAVIAPAVFLRDIVVKSVVLVIAPLAHFRYQFKLYAAKFRKVEPECPGPV